MQPFVKSLSWYLYGGVSCYCLQRFLLDFVYVKHGAHELFQSGDVVILDVWNRLKLTRNNLIYAVSPDNHHQTIFGRVLAFPDESVNTKPANTRVKLVKIPKGNVAVRVLTADNQEEIRILPMGLIEGRVLARIWPLTRYTSRLLNQRSSADI